MSLQELISKKNLTNYSVAKKANVGQATMHQIVNNERKYVRLETASKIANVLGVTVDELNKIIKEGLEGGEKNNSKTRDS